MLTLFERTPQLTLAKVSYASTRSISSAVSRRHYAEVPPPQLVDSFVSESNKPVIPLGALDKLTQAMINDNEKDNKPKPTWQAWIDESPYYNKVLI